MNSTNKTYFASLFLKSFIPLLENHLYYQFIVIPNYDSCTLVELQIHKSPTLNKLFSLLRKSLVDKSLSLNYLCDEIFPLVEILIQDVQDNIRAKSERLEELSHLKVCSNESLYSHLTKLLDQNLELNVYYRDDSFNKFNFMSDNTFHSFLNNIRTSLAVLMSHLYYTVSHTIIKTSSFIIHDEIEEYLGTLQAIRSNYLHKLLLNPDPHFLTQSLPQVAKTDARHHLYSDIEILNWNKFLSALEYHSDKLFKSKHVKDDIDKFCLLFFYSFHTNYDDWNKPDSLDLKSKQPIIKLINDCYTIITSEVKDCFKDWSLFLVTRILYSGYPINFFVLGEIENKTIQVLKIKSSYFASFKEQSLKTSHPNKVTSSDIRNIQKILSNDISKIKILLNFITAINWNHSNTLPAIKSLLHELHSKKDFLHTFFNQLLEIL